MPIQPWIVAICVLAGGYLVGAIPFGLLVMRWAGAGDVRAIGSGNIGATNVLRSGRKDLAALTLLLDAGKGAAVVLVARVFAPEMEALGAVGVFLGHLYPFWLRFRGGKGVATYLGIALAIYWPCGVAFIAAWLLALLATRYSSIGGMAAAVATPVAAAFFFQPSLTLLFLAFALMVLWQHRANLERLLAGTEPRVSFGSGQPT